MGHLGDSTIRLSHGDRFCGLRRLPERKNVGFLQRRWHRGRRESGRLLRKTRATARTVRRVGRRLNKVDLK